MVTSEDAATSTLMEAATFSRFCIEISRLSLDKRSLEGPILEPGDNTAARIMAEALLLLPLLECSSMFGVMMTVTKLSGLDGTVGVNPVRIRILCG